MVIRVKRKPKHFTSLNQPNSGDDIWCAQNVIETISRSHTWRTTMDVWEKGVDKNVRSIEAGSNRRPNKTVYEKLHNLYSSPLIIIIIIIIIVVVIRIILVWEHKEEGARGGWGTALQAGKSQVQFPMVSLECFNDIIIPAALRPWGRFPLTQKLVPWIFSGR
jgi:hypothetical protein